MTCLGNRRSVQLQQPVKMEPGTNSTAVIRTIETFVWKLEPSGVCGSNVNNTSEFPSYVVQAVKVYHKFMP